LRRRLFRPAQVSGIGDNFPMDMVVEGAGPKTIVMIHGWPDTYRLWDGQAAALKDRYRCVRFTLPGFDAGPKRAYPFEELMESLKRVVEQTRAGGRVILLVHDWGCLFGYQFATRYPELVERIVGVDIGDAGSRQHLAEIGAKGKFLVLAYQMWLALAWVMRSDAMARSMARWIGGRSGQGPVYAQMGYLYAMRWFGVAGGLRGFKVFKPQCPMLYIYGERKPFMFHSRAWASRLRSIGFPTGHWVMLQAPDAFNRAVLDWLEETEARG
jgi:pimeloyl-ACP methyl ester carboxylesterase